MKKLIAFILCLTILTVPVVSFAAPIQPFGEESIPLTEDELQQVEGEYKGVVIVGAAGAAFGVYDYLTSTPRSDWTVGGAAKSAANQAIGFVIGAFVGKYM